MSEATTLTAEPTQATAEATQGLQSTEPDAELAEGLALLEEIERPATQTAKPTEPDSTSTESVPVDEDLENLLKVERETASEKARREGAEAKEKEIKDASDRRNFEARLRGIEESFSTRANRLRGALEGVRNGEYELTPELVNGILEEFNAHHAQVSPVTEERWRRGVIQYVIDGLDDEGKKAYATKVEEGSIKVPRDAMDFLVEQRVAAAKKDMLTPIEARHATAKAVVQAKRAWDKQLQDNPGIVNERVNPIQGRSTGTPSRGQQPRSLAEAQQQHADGKISNEQMRAYRAQFNRSK